MKRKSNKKMVESQSLATELSTAATTDRPTYYFTAADLRAGKVDIRPLWERYPSLTRVATLLAGLPFVLDPHGSTTPTVKQEPRIAKT